MRGVRLTGNNTADLTDYAVPRLRPDEALSTLR